MIFTGEWTNPVREAGSATSLIDQGADVIACHVDSPKVVVERAEKRGVMACGHHSSQAELALNGSRPLALGRAAYAVPLPIAAILVAALAFAVFVAPYGRNPVEVFTTLYLGGFASPFARQNTLSRTAPLILAGLAVAIPARAGMIIIGGEGALALGGFAAATYSPCRPLHPPAPTRTAPTGRETGLGRVYRGGGLGNPGSESIGPAPLSQAARLHDGALADIPSSRKASTAPLRKAAAWATNATRSAPVAQLDRALPSEGKGHTFESCRVRQSPQ